MVRRRHAQRRIFELLLPDGEKLADPVLERIDEVLADEELVEVMAAAMEKRRPQSRRRGRPGTPAEVALRMLLLKHLYNWSFDESEREVRGSLVYRGFCRIGCERVPDAKTLIRIGQLLGEEELKGMLERLAALARQRRVVRGRKLRVDTTVVETNIHYPTDSNLLGDGVRVLTRTLKKLGAEVGEGVVKLRDRTRSMTRRVFEIAKASRRVQREKGRERIRTLYREVMGVTRAVLREVEATGKAVTSRMDELSSQTQRRVEGLIEQLGEKTTLVRRVLAQTRARVLKGDTHHPNKVLSLFEPHSEAIRKGKAAKPTEFGKLVKIQEAENQFVTDYQVCQERPSDQTLWGPSLDRHVALFGAPPRIATADRGFSSAANERLATELGVKTVALPKLGRLSKLRRAHERSRPFRRALRWRTGSEGRISALKRRHGLARCRYRGADGMERWVGLGVIANDLLVLARAS